MEINVFFFGQLKEIAGVSAIVKDVQDTEELIEELQRKYPALQQVKYAVAVNKKMITSNTILTTGCTVALLPPFSGG
jgi:molybdopterin synthase sulfur carrier subunit